MSRPFILCADDFGLTRGVNAAILELCGRGRLSAVSALVAAPAWGEGAAALRAAGARIEVGLHLAFTEFPPLAGASSLAPSGKARGQASLMAAALKRALAPGDVAREIDRQIAAFAEAMGRLPDFVDGHQHVHQFPVIARAVVGALAAFAPGRRPWLRVCADSLGAIRARGHGLAAALSAAAMGRRLRPLAQARGIAVNAGLSGFYDVRRAASYASIFPRFLRAMGPRHLVVCHPGHCSGAAERARPWMACREHEFAFLAGPGFAEACARADARIATFAEIAGAQSSGSRSTR
ncbi:MAG: ChbG/HpnK family deacetylase [Alphaproteobacteria bacterium]